MGRKLSYESDARRALSQGDFVTTHAKGFHPAWVVRTDLLPGFQEDFMRLRPRSMSLLRSVLWAWRLFKTSRSYHGVITGSEHTGHMFALMQRLFRTADKRVPHVMVDFPWASSPGPLWGALKRLQIQFEVPALTAVMAHGSPEEARRFSGCFGVPAGKFIFQRYHHTLYGAKYELSVGNYIFSGGDSRDYATLVRAVDGLGVRTVICARRRDYFQGLTTPPNVEIRTVGAGEFNQLMAGAAVVVVPLPSGPIHTGGHTVIANALTMGKALIIAGNEEYRAFVKHDVNGLLIPGGDAAALRFALRRVLKDQELASRLGRNAKAQAAPYQPEAFFERVFGLLDAARFPEDRTSRIDACEGSALTARPWTGQKTCNGRLAR